MKFRLRFRAEKTDRNRHIRGRDVHVHNTLFLLVQRIELYSSRFLRFKKKKKFLCARAIQYYLPLILSSAKTSP